jgi:Zn-dependent protease
MTIIVPAMLILSGSPIIFGGAKPVPVNPMRFKNPRTGMAWVAVAGPITNFILAFICYLFVILGQNSNILQILPGFLGGILFLWASYGVIINLVLAVFNLIPVPPLDGGRIAVGLLPRTAANALAKLERWGLLIVVLLLMSGFVDSVLGPTIDFAINALQPPMAQN